MARSKTISKNLKSDDSSNSFVSKPKKIKMKCDFCDHSFTSEKVFIDHVCTIKMRYHSMNDRSTQMGFRAYQIFYKLSMYKKTPPSMDDFIRNNLYIPFVKYGKYLVDINAIEAAGFTEFLIKNQVKMNDWTAPWAYEVWIRDLNKNENHLKATERTILAMEQWARESGERWQDFFRLVPTTIATKMINNGKISPWVFYAVGEKLISRMSQEQLSMIKEAIEPYFWKAKFKKNQTDFEEVISLFEGENV